MSQHSPQTGFLSANCCRQIRKILPILKKFQPTNSDKRSKNYWTRSSAFFVWFDVSLQSELWENRVGFFSLTRENTLTHTVYLFERDDGCCGGFAHTHTHTHTHTQFTAEMLCILLVLIDASNKSTDHTLLAFGEPGTRSVARFSHFVFAEKRV